MLLNGGARMAALFFGLFLATQVLMIYLSSSNHQLLVAELSRSIDNMEVMRQELTRTLQKAVAELKSGDSDCANVLTTVSALLDAVQKNNSLAAPSTREFDPSACEKLKPVEFALGSSRQNNSKCVRSYIGMPPPDTCKTLKDRHFAIITIDSLRWDTATQAKAPWFDSFFAKHNVSWERRLGHATFSLPAHITILHGGSFGTRGYLQQHKDPNRLFGYLLNWMAGDWAKQVSPPRYIMPEASNLVKSFEKCGYETVGVGGVSWFNDIYETTDLWARDYFQQFRWREHFTPSSDDAFEYQLTETKQLMSTRNTSMPLFFFMNIPSVHFPYRHVPGRGLAKQFKAYEYVDEHFQTLLDLLPRPLQLIVQADHGECFDNDCHGHGTAHPDVFDIPFFEVILEENEGYSHVDPAKRKQPRYQWIPRRRGEFFMWSI